MDKVQRNNINTALATPKDQKRDMNKILMAQQFVLSQMPDMKSEYTKIINCSSHRPCNAPSCFHCGLGVPYRNDTSNPLAYTMRGNPDLLRGISKNFRSRAGLLLEGKLDGFEQSQIFPITLGFHFGTLKMDAKAEMVKSRRAFKRFLKKHLPDAIVIMICDVSPHMADQSKLDFPDADVALEFRGQTRPHVPGLYLHGHGIIAHPTLGQEEIRTVLKQFFKGRRRVCFEPPKPKFFNKKGYECGGFEGWVEYAAMEKTELNFSSDDPLYDNVAVFEAIARVRKGWARNGRKVRVNDKPEQIKAVLLKYVNSCASIDPSVISLNTGVRCFEGDFAPYKCFASEISIKPSVNMGDDNTHVSYLFGNHVAALTMQITVH